MSSVTENSSYSNEEAPNISSDVIWYVNQYAGGPGLNGGHRAYELAKRWNANDCKVVVIKGSFNQPEVQTEHFPEVAVIDGVTYYSIRTNSYQGSIGRIISILIFSIRLFFIRSKLPRNFRTPTAIICSTVHPFSIFAGKYIAGKVNSTLIYEIRDLWPLTLTVVMKMSRFSPLVWASSIAQSFSCKHSQLVVSTLPKADRYFRDIGIKIKGFFFAPNGLTAVAEITPENSGEITKTALETLQIWRADGRTIVVYSGSIGPPNYVDGLVSAMTTRATTMGDAENSPRCLIIGDGVSKKAIQGSIAESKKHLFHFTGRISKSEAQLLLNQCDIAYAGSNNLPDLYKYGISPNKLASYYEAKLPIIMPIYPCGDPISESGGGITRPAYSTQDIVEMLDELLCLPRDKLQALGTLGLEYMSKHYHYDKIATEYLAAIRAAKR